MGKGIVIAFHHAEAERGALARKNQPHRSRHILFAVYYSTPGVTGA